MKHSQGIPVSVSFLAVFAGAIVIGALYDIGVLLAAGIAGAFISLILLPVFCLRVKKVERLIKKEGALIVCLSPWGRGYAVGRACL